MSLVSFGVHLVLVQVGLQSQVLHIGIQQRVVSSPFAFGWFSLLFYGIFWLKMTF